MEASGVKERQKEPVCLCVAWSRTAFPRQDLAATGFSSWFLFSFFHPFFLQLGAVQTHCCYFIPIFIFPPTSMPLYLLCWVTLLPAAVLLLKRSRQRLGGGKLAA